jgi:hypothetical protein
MSATLTGLIALIAVVLIYQGYVTLTVRANSSCTLPQKSLQLVLVWLLPGVGAAIVHAFLLSDNEIPVRPDERFIPNPHGDGDGGGAAH